MNKQFEYWSKQYLFKWHKTTSLKKLEDLIDPTAREYEVICAYIFYSRKQDIVNKKVMYPSLFKALNDWTNNFNKGTINNRFKKVQTTLERYVGQVKNRNNTKERFSNELRKQLKSKNITVNYAANRTGISQSIISRLLNGEYSVISKKRIVEIISEVRNF